MEHWSTVGLLLLLSKLVLFLCLCSWASNEVWLRDGDPVDVLSILVLRHHFFSLCPFAVVLLMHARICSVLSCDNERRCVSILCMGSLLVLVELLRELVLLPLLNQMFDLLVACLDLLQFDFVAASLLFKLLLFSVDFVDVSSARVDRRLYSVGFFGKRLLASLTAMEVNRCVSPTSPHSLAVHQLDVLCDFFDTNSQFLLLRTQLVQLFNQLHVLFEDALILLRVLLCFFLELFLKSLDTILDLGTLLAVNLIDIGSASVMDALIQYPCTVEPHNAFLQLFVAKVVLEEHLLHVVLETLHGV